MKKASKITDAERSEIDILHNKGYSARSIAKALGRSPNTVAAVRLPQTILESLIMD